ncbi:MAG: rod shape-determining protein MreC [Chloroflexota bacterium]
MRNIERRPWTLGDIGIRFLILSLAAILLMALQLTGRLTPIQSAITQLTSPTQLVTTGLVSTVRDWIDFIADLGELRTDNVELEALNAALRAEILTLQEIERENEDLRRLFNFAEIRPGLELRGAQIIARVLGQDSGNFQNFILLDLGTSHGIEIGMPVTTDVGLVGRITEVTASTSTVLLITDPNSGVNAILAENRTNGVIRGTESGILRMDYIPQGTPLKLNETVLTSGLISEVGGGLFPNGIPIGRVVGIIQRDEQVSQQAVVDPSVDFDQLELVLIITNFDPLEIETDLLLPPGPVINPPDDGISGEVPVDAPNDGVFAIDEEPLANPPRDIEQ